MVFMINFLFAVGLTATLSVFMIPTLLFMSWRPKSFRVRLQARLLNLWARSLARSLRIKVRVRGQVPSSDQDRLYLVSNHLGYLDVLVLASVWPLTFVSRHDLAYWPVLGPLTRMVGTVYVDRSSSMRTEAVVKTVVRALEHGSHIHVFAEGKSTNGQQILPFKTALFEAPVRAGVLVQPLTIRYLRVNGRPLTQATKDLVCWYGNKAFIPHTLRLLATRGLEVEIVFSGPIEPGTSRKVLARQARRLIEENFRPLAG